MKKLLLSLSLAVGSIFGAFADTATLTYSELGYTNAEDMPESYKVPDTEITISYSKGTSSNGPKYYSTGSGVRFYNENVITFSVPEGYSLDKMVFSASAANYVVKGTVNNGTFTTSGSTSTWTAPDDKEVTSVVLNSSATCRLQKIEFTYTTPAAAVATPEISYELNGTSSANVSISCATEGATIYYGFSEDAITTEYTAPFEVSKNYTIYATAKKGEDESKLASKKVTGIYYTSFKDVVDLAQKDEEVTISGNFSVLYTAKVGSSDNMILTDGNSNLLIYKVDDVLEEGTNISEINGSVTFFNDLIEIENATLTEGGEGAEYTAKELNTLAGLTKEDNLFDQVILDGCYVSGNSTNGYSAELGSDKLPIYNRYNLSLTNKSYKMSAFVWYHTTHGLQLVPYELEDGTISETVQAPVITPNKSELKEDEAVTITCGTEGAKIYYTTNGTTPTQSSNLYTAPFTITEDVTVKARAFYEGNDGKKMNPSEVVTKEYRFSNPYINIIDNSHEGPGGTGYTTHTCIVDGVEYTMNGIHNSTKNCLQLNKKSGCFIVQSKDNEGLAIEKIVADYNDKTSTIIFTVRASNTAYTADTYTEGDEIGTISATKSTVEFARDYDYFSIYPSNRNDAVYLNSVTIYYRDPRPANEADIPDFAEEFESIIESDEEGLLIGQIPYHLDWYPKYKINDGEEDYLENDEATDCQIISGNFDAATLHNIKIWYEHHYTGATSTVHEFNHMTKPSFSTDAANESMSFGNLGEGVKIYFTINGTDPEIPTSAPANAPRRAKASETDNTYVLDSAEDATATHVISKSNTTVTVHNSVAQAVNINAVAVHEATGTVSDAIKESGVTTSIVAIEAEGAAKAAYDLMGRKVEKPANGLYIIGGKKVRL
ncbi:MAG: chitobiase/beta-hexosaminidase C-terminal domain-containing protein [Muribaculaceae bacterium]|nr:chitobiase/beta-hexosaminidase C-terminal domain-containing protein [Muribaculaceae bacterium]